MLSSNIQTHQTPSTSATVLLSDSTRRYSLTIFASQTADVWISNEPGMVAGQGIFLPAGHEPIYLCVREQGDCIQRGLYIVYSGPLAPVSWIEALDCGEQHTESARKLRDEMR